MAGQLAVRYAVEGQTDKMVAYERSEQDKCNFKLVDLEVVANTEKLPRGG